MKDIVYKHVGMHVSKHVLTTVLLDVIQIVDLDVLMHVRMDAVDVHHVLEHVRVKHINVDV